MTTNIHYSNLLGFIPFNSLMEVHLNELAKHVSVTKHSKGSTLFRRAETTTQRFYLLSGKVELCDANYQKQVICDTDMESQHTLDHHQPHRITATALSDCQILTISQYYLDLILTWDQARRNVVSSLNKNISQEDEQDFSCILQAHFFDQIPAANIEKLLQCFERVPVHKGEKIIKEGQIGYYIYVLTQGKATVMRHISGQGDISVAKLMPGAFFGEDALIGETPRNATIVMATAGTLMRLNKNDFHELLRNPLLSHIGYSQAKQMVADNPDAQIIDVRLPAEYAYKHITGSINIPLISLREKLSTLDKTKAYLVSCDGGARSEVAAYILRESGFQAYVVNSL